MLQTLDGIQKTSARGVQLLLQKFICDDVVDADEVVVFIEEVGVRLLDFWIELAEIVEKLMRVEFVGEDEDDLMIEIFLSDSSEEILTERSNL